MANLSLDRTGRITGSRFPGILGLSPYNTRADVMREMVRAHHWAEEEFTGNFVTDYGQQHEPDAIRAYEAKTGWTVENSVIDDMQLTIVSDDEMFAVTPDGWVTPEQDGEPPRILETKAPFRATYTNINQRPDYYAQVQLQMHVCKLSLADFAVWRYEGTSISHAEYDPEWMKAQFPEVERFLEEYHRIIESEELSAPFLATIEDQRTDDGWLAAVADYFDVMADVAHANAQLERAKLQLQQLAGDATAKGGGLQVIRRVSKATPGGLGAVSYKNAAEALADRLELTKAQREAHYNAHRGNASKGSRGGDVSWAFKNIQDKED